MANKTANTKHKTVRRALRANEYYNPKTKRYEENMLIQVQVPNSWQKSMR